MNYTEEQTEYMVEQYKAVPTMETVQYLADELGKTTKSIIGKLSREGVYKRAVYKSKSGESPITKVELVNNIAWNLGIEVESLVGLEKSPKSTLKTLEVATGALRTLHHEENLHREMMAKLMKGT
jgi:hypothetical protein